MSAELICGNFEYKGETYPFVINDRLLTIVRVGFEYKLNFEEEHIGNLTGFTNANSYITLIGCRRLGGVSYLLHRDIKISLKGYILHDEKSGYFDRLFFQSPALNAFYNPQKAWNFQSEKIGRIKGIEMNESPQTNQAFSCTVAGEKIDCVLGFNDSFFFKPEVTQPLDVQSVFTMDFGKPKPPDAIGKYYLYLRDFLVFLNFRNDIPIGDITLFFKNKKCGRAVIFQHSFDRYKSNANNSITFDDLGISTAPKLFSLIAGRRGGDNFNPYIFPEDDQDECQIDRAKWLIAAISFEGEFNLSFPTYKYETDKSFQVAKDLLLSTIANAVAQSGKGINNPANAALKTFKRQIETSDTTIQEKFAYCENLFANQMADKIQRICGESEVTLQESFAKDYATMRNDTAHGTIHTIQNIDFVTYRMLRCFIYLLIMQRADVPAESMKRIVEKLF